MKMIRQNADCDRLERMAFLHRTIDPAQAIDFANQQIIGSVRDRKREEKGPARNDRALVSRHGAKIARSVGRAKRAARARGRLAGTAQTRLCPPYDLELLVAIHPLAPLV